MAGSEKSRGLLGVRTRVQRAFLVLLVTLIAAFNAYYVKTDRIFHPTEWLFYTISSDGFDIHSPTGTKIIDWELGSSPKDVIARCSHQKPLVVSSAIWRDVSLCNTGSFAGEEFEIRHKYFVAQVDELYYRYYEDVFARSLLATVVAIGAWLVCLALYGIFLWVMRD